MRYLALFVALAAAVCALLSPYYQLDFLPALAPGLNARDVTPPSSKPPQTKPNEHTNEQQSKPNEQQHPEPVVPEGPAQPKTKPHPDENNNPPKPVPDQTPNSRADPSAHFDITQIANSHIVKYSQATRIDPKAFSILMNEKWEPIRERYVQLSGGQRRGIIKRAAYEATISLDNLNLQEGASYRIGYQVGTEGENKTEWFVWRTSTQSSNAQSTSSSKPSGTASPASSTPSSSPSPSPSPSPISGEAPSTFCRASAWFWSSLFIIFWWHI